MRKTIVFSEAELAYLREHPTTRRKEVLAGLVERFGRTDLSEANLRQHMRKLGLRTGRAATVPTIWSEEEIAFVESRQAMARKAIHAAFLDRFDRPDVTLANIRSLCTRKGWITRSVSPRVAWSDEEIAFVEANQTLSRKALHAALVQRFGRHDISEENIKTLAYWRGFRTGRTGTFEKGSTPVNKGKKCPPGVGGRSAAARRTQFPKGHRGGKAAEVYQPIGIEVVRQGYLFRKVNDDTSLPRRWKSVHSIRWEEANGPVPEGHALKCLDGDRMNTDPSNWEAVHRGVISRLNRGRMRKTLAYDDAPAELKPLVLASAKLKHGVSQARRRGG